MHINDDKLIEYALEIIYDDTERAGMKEHLEACRPCRDRLKKLQDDIDVIGSIHPQRIIASTRGRSRMRRALYSMLRAAALIIIGVAIGFGASAWLEDEPAHVSYQYIALSPPADSIGTYVVSDATDISSSYDRHMAPE